MSQEFRDLDENAPQQIENIAPEKYGKAAYAHLTYTPSRLKENILYIEAVALKKDQEKNSKLREITAENDVLMDKVDQLKREKQGIQNSLNQQIAMYKTFISELQKKYEIKIKDMQGQFQQQMRVVIEEQEQRAKIIQAEKQNYQNQINDLKIKNNELQRQLKMARQNIHELEQERKKLHISQKQITFQLEQAKQLKEAHEGIKQNQCKQLKDKLFHAEENYKVNLHTAKLEKDKQIDELKRRSFHDISKLQQKISKQSTLKNSQIQQLTKTFSSQLQRLNDQLSQRQNTIAQLRQQNVQQKQKILQMTRAYDRQINNLIYQKNRTITHLDQAKAQNLQFLQREKLHPLTLNLQIGKLKQLLRQSSYELQKCKEEIVCMDKERGALLERLARNQALNLSRKQYTSHIYRR